MLYKPELRFSSYIYYRIFDDTEATVCNNICPFMNKCPVELVNCCFRIDKLFPKSNFTYVTEKV